MALLLPAVFITDIGRLRAAANTRCPTTGVVKNPP